MPKRNLALLVVAIILVASALNCGGAIQPGTSSSAGSGSGGSGSGGGSNGGGSNGGGSGGGGSGSGGSGAGGAGGSSGSPTGTTFWNLHQKNGWTGYGLLPPSYNICTSCAAGGPQVTWSKNPGVSTPSLSGNSTQFDIGGSQSFSDVLWNNHLIGDFSSQGLPDANQTINAAAHNFNYEVYFYVKDVSVSQALEFDINQFVDGQSFIWGHECRIAGGNEWDIWDNQGKKWHPTGVACNPVSASWNHLIIQVQRTSNSQLLFQSITLNGETHTLNYVEDPTSTTWNGIAINYQQDGNRSQQAYSVWLDWMNFTYW